MDKSLVEIFLKCNDEQLIEYALLKAKISVKELRVLKLLINEGVSVPEAAYTMCISTARLQKIWDKASNKLLAIPWLVAYANELKERK